MMVEVSSQYYELAGYIHFHNPPLKYLSVKSPAFWDPSIKVVEFRVYVKSLMILNSRRSINIFKPLPASAHVIDAVILHKYAVTCLLSL